MLKIIRSGRPSATREAFVKEIKRLSESGKRVYLIVPEQQTVMAEGMMARELPPSSVLTVEVTNFTRFANTTFRALGGLSGEYCNSVKKALIMWRTLTELSPALSMTSGRKEINAGLVELALSAIGQMQNLGISPTDLSELAGHEQLRADSRLESKLSDLYKIYSLYKSTLGERYADTGDDAQVMINKLSEHPEFLSDTAIYIEGFTSFTEPQHRLIALLAARTTVSLGLVLPKGREGAFEYSEIVDTERRLTSAARRVGAEIKLLREEGTLTKRDEALDEIFGLLWSTTKPKDNITLHNSDILRIFEANTPYDECIFICDDIKRRVMDGASYSDFAIVARGVESYRGILDTALCDADIPFFSSIRRDINEFEAIKLIYTAYAVIRGFAREDVICYAKCALSGVGRAECDEFEMYVNKWQIGGRRFTDEGVWNMNPDGYSLRRSEDADARLVRIHETREKIIRPLIGLASRASAASTVEQHARILLDFLLEIDMEDALRRRAEELAAMGEVSLAKENGELWQMICNGLDTLVEVLGDAPADADAFLSQLKVVFSATDIGRIPAYLDQLTVGSADMLRLYEKKHIYLIGVNVGQFPATVSDSAYFSERDVQRLSDMGLAITPELEIKGARELYFFSRALSYATDSVTLSYCVSDTKFKAVAPAEVIGRIALLSGDQIRPIRIASIPITERLYSPKPALSSIGDMGEEYGAVREALVDSGFEREILVSEGDISNSVARLGGEIISSDRPLSLTQTRIDSYVSCPFGYFCRYIVDLQEDERAEFDARSIGSFIHAILENFFSSLREEGRESGELSADEIRQLTERSAKEYISQLGEEVNGSFARTKIKIDRLCRAALPVVEGLCEEFSQSAFSPRFFELSLRGGEESPDPVRLRSDSGAVSIYGIIDRVDAYKKGEDVYLRVIDYKTGQKEFSPEDLAEGSNLQMFLYLKALVESENKKFRDSLGVGEGGRLRPGGVIYVKTSVRDVRVDTPDDQLAAMAVKSAQRREGMILDDPDVIEAMNLKYTPLYSRKTPDKIPDSKRDLLYTEEGWEDIMRTVEGAVLGVADGIRGGVMDATPKEKKGKTPCEYCPYKPICRRG